MIKRTKPLRKRKRGKEASLRREANRLWSLIVKRNGCCEFMGEDLEGEPHFCMGPHQAAHGFGKKAHPSIRYEPINGFDLCARAHVYYTWQPHRWDRYLRDAWGPEVYEELWKRATSTAKLDMEAVVEKLRQEWEGK